MLELDEGQLSRPVLRGRGGSNTSLLPGCEKKARVSPTPNGGARVYAHCHEETWPPDMRIAQDLSISRVRKAGKKLDGPQRGQVHPGLIWQDAVRARPSSPERTWASLIL